MNHCLELVDLGHDINTSPASFRADAVSEAVNAFIVESFSNPLDTVRPWFTEELKKIYDSPNLQELHIPQIQALKNPSEQATLYKIRKSCAPTASKMQTGIL